MIKLDFTDEMVATASYNAKKLGEINNTITGEQGNFAGYLGEEVLAPYIDAVIMSSDGGDAKYNHDMIVNGFNVEVKTKRRLFSPRLNYEGSVGVTSMHQQPDLYAFMSIKFRELISENPRVYKGLQEVWFCGFLPIDEFYKRSVLKRAGIVDETNGHVGIADKYNVFYNNTFSNINGYIEKFGGLS